jgi:hypothetical protein
MILLADSKLGPYCGAAGCWRDGRGVPGAGHAPETDNSWVVGKNEAACAADAAREVVERWLPNG